MAHNINRLQRTLAAVALLELTPERCRAAAQRVAKSAAAGREPASEVAEQLVVGLLERASQADALTAEDRQVVSGAIQRLRRAFTEAATASEPDYLAAAVVQALIGGDVSKAATLSPALEGRVRRLLVDGATDAGRPVAQREQFKRALGTFELARARR